MLDQEVEHLALVDDCPPKPVSSITDLDNYLVDMPVRARAWTATSKIALDQATKLEKPAPDRLIRNVDATLCQQFLDVAKRQRESCIAPNRVLYFHRRKELSLEGYRGHPATVVTPAQPGQTFNGSMPGAPLLRVPQFGR